MKKTRIVDIAVIAIIALSIVFLGVFSILWSLNQAFYQMTLYFVMGFGIIGLLGVMIKLFLDKKYEFNTYRLAFMASLTVIAIFCHYFIKYVNYYENLPYIYWIILIVLIIIAIIICYLLNKKAIKKNKDKNEPKFIPNIR